MNAYTLEVTGARYGLAYGCASAAGDAITLTVIQATVAETTRVTVACGGLSTRHPVMITGTIAGLTSAQTARRSTSPARGQRDRRDADLHRCRCRRAPGICSRGA